MTIPQPPSDLGVQFLQEIWDFAETNRRWPTAVEIDEVNPRRTEAGNILCKFPAGLIYGIGPHNPGWPDRTRKLGLTVAAIAACEATDDIIAAFLAFVRKIGQSCRSKHAPPNMLLRSSSAAFPYNSISDISYRYQVAAVGRVGQDVAEAYVRELLRIIVEVETAGWAIIESDSESDGCWNIAFDQSFNTFAEVTELRDYWSRRFKPWEFGSLDKSNYRRVRSTPDPYNRARIFWRNSTLIDDVFLAAIEARAEGRTAEFFPCPPFDYQINPMLLLESLQRLGSRGYIFRPTLDPDPGLPTVALSSEGIAHLKNLRAAWVKPAYRNRAARNALLSWLYDQKDDPQVYVQIRNFLGDPRSIDLGNLFTSTDVDAAASYLMERGLIRTASVDQQPKPGLARITVSGIDCVEEGGSVSDYLKHPATGGPSYTFNAPVSATNFAAGDHAKQHATSHGITVAEVRFLMQAIIEAAPGLSLPAEQANEIRVIATQALTDADEDVEDHSRFRQAAQKLRAILAASGKTALSAALTALIDSALVKAGLPPGSTA